MTNNGKIDRKALASEKYQVSSFDTEYGTASSLERQIIALWERVLGINGISVHCNFFEVGGNSIAIIELHNLITKEFSKPIQVVELFENYSPSMQAQLVSNNTTVVVDKKTPDVSSKRRSRRVRIKQKQEKL